ncbi:unnamed protein product [Caenorhabditis brenneri]
MTIPLRRLPFLVQQIVIKQMRLKPIFLLTALSTKMSKIVFLALRLERISLTYNVNRSIEITRQVPDEHRLDLFHQSKQCLALEYKFFKILKQDDVSTREVSTEERLIKNSIQTFWQFELEVLMKFILRKSPNAILKLKFGTPDIEIFRNAMQMIKESKLITKLNVNEIKVEPCLSDLDAIWARTYNDFLRLVLNEGRCAERLHVYHISSDNFVYDINQPPFTFDEFYFTDAEWISKNHFLKLLLTCKSVYLLGVEYSNEDLVEILKGWQESSSLDALYILRLDFNYELDLETIMQQFPQARIVRCARFPSDSPNRNTEFFSKQCFEIQKWNGEQKLIIYDARGEIIITSHCEALEFGGEKGQNWQDVGEDDENEEMDDEQ